MCVDRERECVCVCDRERECVLIGRERVCVCVIGRERAREEEEDGCTTDTDPCA